MNKEIEVKYFNSFLLKKTIRSLETQPLWCGDPANPDFYPEFPIQVNVADQEDIDRMWYAEESRIYGGFNEDEVDLGVRAYALNDNNDITRLKSSMIYSGIVNTRTGVNNTNVFSIAESITKSLDPSFGGIEYMYADDSNLLILQEGKASQILINKDALFTSEGSRNVTSSNVFLGDVSQYAGDYGIGRFPESFAVKGNRKYFSSVPNSAVMRLSVDGLTEISKYGMEDFFRDEFNRISPDNKRILYDLEWTIPWGLFVGELNVSGENITNLEIGMGLEGINGVQDLFITNIEVLSEDEYKISLSKGIWVTASPQPSIIQAYKVTRDKVVGGFDDNYDNYVISVEYNPPSRTTQVTLISNDIPEPE